MSVLTLTPTGDTAVDLDSTSTYIRLDREGLALPIEAFEEAFSEGVDSEGGRLVRSQPQNVPAVVRVNLGSERITDAQFYAALRIWQTAIEACRRKGGELVYTPPNGTAVTYDVVSARITEAPQVGIYLAQHYASSTAEFTCLPFGRLAEATQNLSLNDSTFTATVTATTPLLEIYVRGVPGSTDALALLTLTDMATQNRHYLDYGIGPIVAGESTALIDSDDMSTGSGSVQTTQAGAYDPNATGSNVIRGPALSTSSALIATKAGTWYGPKRIKARIFAPNQSGIYVAAGVIGPQAIRTYGAWKLLPTVSGFVEVDLGVFAAPAGRTIDDIGIAQYSPTRTAQLDLDYIEVYPAQIYGQLSQTSSPYAITSGGSSVIRYDGPPRTGVNGRDIPGFTGAALRLPPGNSRIVCKARRTDVAAGVADANVADSLRAALQVTPRVVLMGPGS